MSGIVDLLKLNLLRHILNKVSPNQVWLDRSQAKEITLVCGVFSSELVNSFRPVNVLVILVVQQEFLWFVFILVPHVARNRLVVSGHTWTTDNDILFSIYWAIRGRPLEIFWRLASSHFLCHWLFFTTLNPYSSSYLWFISLNCFIGLLHLGGTGLGIKSDAATVQFEVWFPDRLVFRKHSERLTELGFLLTAVKAYEHDCLWYLVKTYLAFAMALPGVRYQQGHWHVLSVG